MPAANVARIGIGLQTAKGVPSTAPLYWLNLTGGGMRPTPETEQRSETGLGRDVGATFIRVLSAAGDPSFLLRPATAGLLYYCALGAKSVTDFGTLWTTGATYTLGQVVRAVDGKIWEITTAGTGGTATPTGTTIGQTFPATGGVAVYTLRQLTTAPKLHTLSPANDQPWVTVWKELGDSIYEKFADAKFTAANLEFAAGGDLALSTTAMGLGFERLAASPGGGIHDQAVPIRVPGSTYTIGGSVDNSLASGNINIEAAQNPVQTNTSTYSYIEPGQRAITFGYEGVYVDVSRYAQVYYGAPAGTLPTLQVFETTISLRFGPAYGPYIKFTAPRALLTEATSDPDPGGAPMMLSVAGALDRPLAGNILDVEVQNDVLSYLAA
jgi:hypothetical protein